MRNCSALILDVRFREVGVARVGLRGGGNTVFVATDRGLNPHRIYADAAGACEKMSFAAGHPDWGGKNYKCWRSSRRQARKQRDQKKNSLRGPGHGGGPPPGF